MQLNNPKKPAASSTAASASNQDETFGGEVGPYDVLCGRHKLAFNNVGNRRFRVTVSLHINLYTSAPDRQGKSAVIRAIMNQVHASGGRFLKRTKEGWVELDQRQAHDKVGHALRDMLNAKEMTSPASPASSEAKKKVRRQRRTSNSSQSSSSCIDIFGGDDNSNSNSITASSVESNATVFGPPVASVDVPTGVERLDDEDTLAEAAARAFTRPAVGDEVEEAFRALSGFDIRSDDVVSAPTAFLPMLGPGKESSTLQQEELMRIVSAMDPDPEKDERAFEEFIDKNVKDPDL